MPCPAQMLGNVFTIRRHLRRGTAYVECGGLPPLYAVSARRGVLQLVAMTARSARQPSD